MKIVRDGQEYELTSDELYQAYIEQECLFDRENIASNMDWCLDEDEFEVLKDNQDFIEDATYKLRRNQDKYDMSYEYALSDAFETVKKEYLKYVFDNEIIVSNDRTHLEGYVWATDFLISLVKKEMQDTLSAEELRSMENINFYPVYDVLNNSIQLCGHFYFQSNDVEIGKAFELSLNPCENSKLLTSFESYCQKQEGMSCVEFIDKVRREEGLNPLAQASLSDQILSARKRIDAQDASNTFQKDRVL